MYPKCAGATLFFITGSNSNTSRARRGSVSGAAASGGEAGSWAGADARRGKRLPLSMGGIAPAWR
jgi:hypothetical protein